ncbi:hypothetical protein CFY86_21365 [Raoultella ornithinolytica]|uniref:Uncharacterized protein n=1 Tax=Raoultella ornithinolytica TaxID=54291 RepID=A0A855EW93_RAOOR|nr:hypothetical protein CFY86_21365 [Raoultella ornithinolytica]PJR11422.1 hypothetical protein CDD79_03985 [Raoultella ornithinolytica]
MAKWLTMRRWLEENPGDEFASEVRTELTIAAKNHTTYTREYWLGGSDSAVVSNTRHSRRLCRRSSLSFAGSL